LPVTGEFLCTGEGRNKEGTENDCTQTHNMTLTDKQVKGMMKTEETK
jgi:hypothetical protein